MRRGARGGERDKERESELERIAPPWRAKVRPATRKRVPPMRHGIQRYPTSSTHFLYALDLRTSSTHFLYALPLRTSSTAFSSATTPYI